MKKAIGFEELKKACEDKWFEDRGNGHYFIKCKRGIPFCNERVCPVWNSLEDEKVVPMSLKDLNLKLKEH